MVVGRITERKESEVEVEVEVGGDQVEDVGQMEGGRRCVHFKRESAAVRVLMRRFERSDPIKSRPQTLCPASDVFDT